MANQILAGAVVQAGMVIAGVDANNPPYVGPPPISVGWSNAGLSESERVAPAANGMQLYRHDQPYTNAHPNRTLHNLPEYLEGLPFTVESSSPSPENGIEGTPNSLEEYTFNTSGTLYLIVRSDWGGYDQNPHGLQQLDVTDPVLLGVLDPSSWDYVEHNVGYMGGGGDYGTLVFSKHFEAGTYSLNNLYHYAFKIDPPPPIPSWIVVGAPDDSEAGQANNYSYRTGAAYVYDANDLSASPTKLMLDGPLWNQQQIGGDVAVSADKIVIGSKEDNNAFRDGSVYVYDTNDLTAQPTKLTAFDGAYNDQFGFSDPFNSGNNIAVTSDKIVVGACCDDDNGSNSGSFYVFDANNLSATPTKLTTFDGAEGDNLGRSIAATDDKIFIGVSADDDNGRNSGSVYVYDANNLSATPTKLTSFDGIAFDSFGSSVAATTDKVIVGAPYSNGGSGSNSGSVYVYDANNLSATPTKLTAFDGAGNDYFGYSIDATTDKIVISASRNNEMGAVYVYDANNLSATPTKLTAFDGAPWDEFGSSVAVISNKIIVGANMDDGNGSVYVFDGNDLSAQPIKLIESSGKFGSSVAAI